ncbi:hypothetical protein EDC94DRAFT_652847 [Helicostylum pulchrum]|nr:hypothetical protein EDC94DRAFT_652847 [Helicostylum pulchrum]
MEEISEELALEAANRKYNVYSDKQKAVFYYFNRVKLWKAAASGRKAQVEVRTAQKWAKRPKEGPDWNIYEKQTNVSNRRLSQLQEEHKKHLIQFFDEYPQATRRDTVESLTEEFENFGLKETSVGNFILHECNLTFERATLHPVARNSAENREKRYQWAKKWVQTTDMSFLENCVFVDEAGFNINMRSPNARSLKGTPAVIETPSTRAISLTILGAITAHDVISIESREPLKPKKVKVDGSRKRKNPLAKASRKGTVTGHYMRGFPSNTLLFMNYVLLGRRNFYKLKIDIKIGSAFYWYVLLGRRNFYKLMIDIQIGSTFYWCVLLGRRSFYKLMIDIQIGSTFYWCVLLGRRSFYKLMIDSTFYWIFLFIIVNCSFLFVFRAYFVASELCSPLYTNSLSCSFTAERSAFLLQTLALNLSVPSFRHYIGKYHKIRKPHYKVFTNSFTATISLTKCLGNYTDTRFFCPT